MVVIVLGVLRRPPILSSDGLVTLGVRVTGVPRRPSISSGHWSLLRWYCLGEYCPRALAKSPKNNRNDKWI